ncbi:hypothetical protein SISNIDRAFT_489391 [Sistotremastrum niveocremeum HHB9708]|uniref:JmjC domain-containing protein n=1 Tax=Sistotremastrum niveocremeum HHB9708 TaxID=1314777 RepID=A0A164PZ58_9AGAM|nr:hypothetical protein SISNIDRAFT_489391 [Sistotremastrum niveocremeum HHB9708]
MRPGDKLFMPPGTVHAVFTVQTSIARGSVYYLASSYDQTLFALLEEHVAGLYVTNTTDLAFTGNLFRLWMYYHRLWEANEHRDVPLAWPVGLPPARSFAAFTVILSHLTELTPELVINPTDPPLWPDGYKRDRSGTLRILKRWLAKRLKLREEGKASEADSSYLEERRIMEAEFSALLPEGDAIAERPRDLWDVRDRRRAARDGDLFFPTAAAEEAAARQYQEERRGGQAPPKRKREDSPFTNLSM